jgi:CBS domain-containing protein
VQSQTAIFSKLVNDFMRDSPVVVASGCPVGEAVALLAKSENSCVTVINGDGTPVGIMTEADVADRIAFQIDKVTPIDTVMTSPVVVIDADEYLYHAIARMRRLGIRHMPVVDTGGIVVGALDLHDALAVAGGQLMGQIDSLTRDDSIAGLTEVKAAQVELAHQLFADNLPATDIQELLTHINRDIYNRVVEMNLAAMKSEGLGDPPVPFCVIVMGSGGRGENYLFPDQDNGFILDDYPDEHHTEIDGWFIDLAERMVWDLDKVGVPLCNGGVMANNPLWRKTLPQWKAQISLWSRKRDTAALRLCDIFFDYRIAWGEQRLADELREHVTKIAHTSPMFLRQMYEDDVEHRVALGVMGGLFQRFVTETENKDHLGELNLKHTGTLPLVEAIRLLSLREGIEQVSTLGRMEALHKKGVLDNDEYDYLIGAFRHICRLLLRQQIKDFKAEDDVSNYVDPDSLSEREKDILVDSFKAIRELRGRVKGEFTGDIF